MFIRSFIRDPFCLSRPPYPGRRDRRSWKSVAALLELDVEAERPEFLHQDVERLRDARLEVVVAADDRLVDLGAAGDVVGLHREHLLERVRRAVGLERPDFHLAEALAA